MDTRNGCRTIVNATVFFAVDASSFPDADGQIKDVDAKDFSIWALTTISETKEMS